MTIDWASYGLREPDWGMTWKGCPDSGVDYSYDTTLGQASVYGEYVVFQCGRFADGEESGEPLWGSPYFVTHGFEWFGSIESAAAHLVRLGCGLKA